MPYGCVENTVLRKNLDLRGTGGFRKLNSLVTWGYFLVWYTAVASPKASAVCEYLVQQVHSVTLCSNDYPGRMFLRLQGCPVPLFADGF